MLNPDIIEQKVPAFGESLKARHAPADWKANMRSTASMMTSLGDGLALTEMQLQQIPNPVLLCLGELDTMVTAEETQWAAAHLPNGEYKLIPGWKHPIETVDPAALADAIRFYFLTH
jgi:pimeloyl-ACP methyl ester carboxylesterase